jgi:dienelactone hydrolase
VIRELIKLNTLKSSLFCGRLDIENIGIFGHSLGGRIAGQAIADNKKIKAYISMEGIAPRAVRQNGIKQTMAYLMSEDIVKYAMVNYEQSIPQ